MKLNGSNLPVAKTIVVHIERPKPSKYLGAELHWVLILFNLKLKPKSLKTRPCLAKGLTWMILTVFFKVWAYYPGIEDFAGAMPRICPIDIAIHLEGDSHREQNTDDGKGLLLFKFQLSTGSSPLGNALRVQSTTESQIGCAQPASLFHLSTRVAGWKSPFPSCNRGVRFSRQSRKPFY